MGFNPVEKMAADKVAKEFKEKMECDASLHNMSLHNDLYYKEVMQALAGYQLSSSLNKSQFNNKTVQYVKEHHSNFSKIFKPNSTVEKKDKKETEKNLFLSSNKKSS